ncbi:hypothetical protein BU25DRAFT_432893 [Macroventuria anomochaeta]|uniref:Uncharacterized protein n=1 Tax=Macroventuria anomochaeta TaxID=301207 RepID=A0ACB6RVA9_9PLEO|nr:uncharacterized protein BU25DRAFT_432893 [Macroventuria anomochaeta]KAF2625227.1 hypothetical protein BU25DRAFT_432893 [Macroventuria anomochaeta]
MMYPIDEDWSQIFNLTADSGWSTGCEWRTAIVVENKARLGGHTETYTDPQSGYPIDMGVKLYHEESIVYEWFTRFNPTIEINVSVTGGAAAQNVDFRTGQILDGLPAANQTFVQKYDTADAVQFIFGISPAFDDILELPTLHRFRPLSLGLLAITNNFQTSSATAELLTANSLLLSKVLATERVSDSGSVKVLVDTPKGRNLIIAKKLFMTVPPTPAALTEAVGYYTSVIRNAGPVNITLQNLAPDQPYALPPVPATNNVNPTFVNPSLSLVYCGTKVGQILNDDQAKAAIIADLKRYQAANGMEPTESEFVAFSNNSPYNMLVGSEATKAGCYKYLYALQGKRNTFWSGAMWRAHDSSGSWAFTNNSVLPALVASL